MRALTIWLLASCLAVGPAARSAESPYSVSSEPKRSRTFLLPPMASFLLPGFDQWWEGQHGYAGLYTGIAAGAIVGEGLHDTGAGDISQWFTLAAGFSLLHSFKSAVRTREDFAFMKIEESPAELALAPFRVSYMGRVTTLIPLVIAFGLGFIEDSSSKSFSNLTGTDAYRAASRSYLAGTWEEAVFRGWMMPVIQHYTGSDFASNVLTSVVFAAAHLGTNSRPWPQLAGGLYFGYVSQQNGWTLGESMFIHAWYDLFLFLGSYIRTPARVPAFRLPTLRLTF